MMLFTEYPNEDYDTQWMEREEQYYADVAYGESRLAPTRSPVIESCCTADDYPDGTNRG